MYNVVECETLYVIDIIVERYNLLLYYIFIIIKYIEGTFRYVLKIEISNQIELLHLKKIQNI